MHSNRKIGKTVTVKQLSSGQCIIQMESPLIMATRTTIFNCMSALSYALFPMFIAHEHTNYAQYAQYILINLSDIHRRCKERLEQNGFNMSQSLVLCLRNAFGITIKQTISLCQIKRGIISFSS